jgi:hypothetical protein
MPFQRMQVPGNSFLTAKEFLPLRRSVPRGRPVAGRDERREKKRDIHFSMPEGRFHAEIAAAGIQP